MASSLSPSPSAANAQLRTLPPPSGPADKIVSDFEAVVRKLIEEDSVTLVQLLSKFDDKELVAARKYIDQVKKKRYGKKKLEIEKKSRWKLLRSRGAVSDKVEKAKEDIDLELGDAVLPQCYEEIKRLLFIEKDPVCAKALQEWSRKEVLFTNRVERKKSKVADLKNEIYQLIGFFSVFQGVLLTAVSQSNLLHCNNWWSPILLSLVASGVTIFGVVQKLFQIESFQKTIHSEEQSLKEVAARVNALRNQGKDTFEFAQFSNREDKKQSKLRFRVYFWLVIGSLVLFTAGFPLSHWRILCDSGSNPYAATVSSSQ